jgi:hypothetical protein
MATPVVKLDGLFEAVLGLVLVAGAAAGGLDSTDFPRPVGTPLIVVAGCALLLVGAVLWRVSPTPGFLRGLAAGNLATALAAVVWLTVANGFSTPGSALMLVTMAALSGLAVAQLLAARDVRRLPTTP